MASPAYIDQSTQQYIQRVRAIPTLDRETEMRLAVAAKGGDGAARTRLIEANLRHVVSVALLYRRYKIKVSELIAEGNLGLMTAVEKFDPERGNRFVTYAGYWIRAFILEAVVRSTTMVGGGRGAFRSKVYFKIRRERAKVASLTTDPEERLRLLAERMGTSVETVSDMLRRIDASDVSMEQPVFDDGAQTLRDQIAAEGPGADEVLDARKREASLGGQLGRALEGLDERERFIMERRYLADEDRSPSLAEIGRELGVSRERARQLEARAKQKLRASLGAYAA